MIDMFSERPKKNWLLVVDGGDGEEFEIYASERGLKDRLSDLLKAQVKAEYASDWDWGQINYNEAMETLRKVESLVCDGKHDEAVAAWNEYVRAGLLREEQGGAAFDEIGVALFSVHELPVRP